MQYHEGFVEAVNALAFHKPGNTALAKYRLFKHCRDCLEEPLLFSGSRYLGGEFAGIVRTVLTEAGLPDELIEASDYKTEHGARAMLARALNPERKPDFANAIRAELEDELE